MARDFFINGETMVLVKGNVASAIPTLTQLGLCDSPVRITFNFKYKDINVDSWGNTEVPTDVQCYLTDANIQTQLVHYDQPVLEACMNESLGSAVTIGTMQRTGTRMGNNAARFSAANSYIGLNLTSPVAGLPWRFWYAYMVGPPITIPLGTERSLTVVNWRAIPYTNDPWGGGTAQPGTAAGTGSFGAVLFDRTLDS